MTTQHRSLTEAIRSAANVGGKYRRLLACTPSSVRLEGSLQLREVLIPC